MEGLLWIVALPAFVGGFLYAGIVAAARRLTGVEWSRLNRIAALCWLIGLSALLWVWFKVVDAEAAAVSRANVGIPLVFAWAWATVILPAPFIGTATSKLCIWWLRSRRG
jgi:hypothetical protein